MSGAELFFLHGGADIVSTVKDALYGGGLMTDHQHDRISAGPTGSRNRPGDHRQTGSRM
jgi:hypothetical protein